MKLDFNSLACEIIELLDRNKIINEIVVEVNPRLITLWKYESSDGRSYRDYLDLNENTAFREYNNP